ncbi:MAG: CapA family protein [Chloroflexi bacterium]|nr:CapA family protein [Chloroflexota bacterium]
MLYEAEAGDLSLIAVGDMMVTQKLSVYREPRYLALVELIRGADAAFANLEMTFHNYEVAPGLSTSPAYSSSDPRNLEEYKWMGFKLVTMAHNHHNDYGIDGLLTSARHVEAAGLVHAGAGYNLAEARAPGYLETPRGRIALLSCVSSFVEAGAATHQRPDHKGRAGISPLRHQLIYTVDRPAFDQIKRISRELGLEARKESRRRWVAFGDVPQDTDTEFNFVDRGYPSPRRIYRLGEGFGVTSIPDRKDLADILKWVREARRQADWVLMSIHCHEEDLDPEAPPAFLQAFARACIDEGVDVFIGHGPHFTRGVEIYKGKPILYGLGNFVFQNETYKWAPQDTYEAHGLGYEHTPADAWDARTVKGTASFYLDPKYWHGLVAQPVFKGWKLQEVRLYIADQGYGQPRSRNGRPVLADEEMARRALERVARLSKPFGTEIKIADGVGIIAP